MSDADKKPEKIELVKMVKTHEVDGTPLAKPIHADIHPDEVDNSIAAGYKHHDGEAQESGSDDKGGDLDDIEKMKVVDIQAKLAEKGIAFDKKATKATLIELLKAAA